MRGSDINIDITRKCTLKCRLDCGNSENNVTGIVDDPDCSQYLTELLDI